MTAVSPGPTLEMLGIWKRFGAVEALRGADFVLQPGEVHALLGENGAGKSTLMHIAFGLAVPDAGVVRVGGRSTRLRSPLEAKMAGIGMVHQHFTSIPTMTVGENLRLAQPPRRLRHRASARQGGLHGSGAAAGRAAAARLREALLVGVGLDRPVEELSVGEKQRLEIAQALSANASILLLDEPTAVLAPGDVKELLSLLRVFARGGGSIVFITHKLNEALAAADRVTVLRRGEVTLTGAMAEHEARALARAMVGEAMADAGPHEVARTAPTSGPAREVCIDALGIVVHAGEIVGVAAVEGNGQREMLRRIAGVPPSSTSDAAVGWGHDVTSPRRSPARDPSPPRLAAADATGGRRADLPEQINRVVGPLAFLPEDRSTEGLIPSFTLTENLVLGHLRDPRWSDGPWIRWPAARHRMEVLLGEFDIRASGPDAVARTLSGGNQQKVVFARAMEASPRVIIAENPTRGLDFRATAFVHDRLRAAARDGAAVLFYSTDLDELLAVATRVVVVYRGRVLPVSGAASREEIGALMVGAA